MSSPDAVEPQQWTVVDEGWGRHAADFATLSEPGNCREYVALHQLLGVAPGDDILDTPAVPASPSSWPRPAGRPSPASTPRPV